MALDIICEAPEPHTFCDDDLKTDNVYAHSVGTVARCRKCGQFNVLRFDAVGRYWDRISERKARKLLKKLGCE